MFEPRWRAYSKAAVFLLPAVSLWMFAAVFLFPKLKLIWHLGGGGESDLDWLMVSLNFLTARGGLFLGLLVAGLVAMELPARPWARFRGLTLGSLVLLLNTTVLLGLTGMCVAALLIAPALMQPK